MAARPRADVGSFGGLAGSSALGLFLREQRDVDLLALRQRVADRVIARRRAAASCDRARSTPFSRSGAERRAPRDVAGIGRRRAVEHAGAGLGMDAVGADQARWTRALREPPPASSTVIEMPRAWVTASKLRTPNSMSMLAKRLQARYSDVGEIGAVHHRIGHAVALAHRRRRAPGVTSGLLARNG